MEKLQLVALVAAVEMAASSAATKAAEATVEADAYQPHTATLQWDADDWLWERETVAHKEHLVALARATSEHAASLAKLADLARSALENISRAD